MYAEHDDMGLAPTTLLLEVAGAVDYTDSKAVAHNKRRWTIWNIAQAAKAAAWVTEGWPEVTMKIAPSSKWTKGHDIKVRHKLAGCDAKQKDLRECQAMIWYYTQTPSDWVTFDKYLEDL